MMKFELTDPLFLPHCACDLELELAPGKVLVLVGENGIGKSTLLSRFDLSLHPSQKVFVEQKALECFFERKLSVLKNIFLQSKLENLDVDFFNYLWKHFLLESKEQRMVSQLSGGELQALKLCLLLPKEASLYLLDEPSQYLDDVRKKVLLMAMEMLQEKKRHILMVEHGQEWFGKDWMIQELRVQQNILMKGKQWII